jgi:hypothetical protein
VGGLGGNTGFDKVLWGCWVIILNKTGTRPPNQEWQEPVINVLVRRGVLVLCILMMLIWTVESRVAGEHMLLRDYRHSFGHSRAGRPGPRVPTPSRSKHASTPQTAAAEGPGAEAASPVQSSHHQCQCHE